MHIKTDEVSNHRKKERGAALVTSLLISMLLLTVAGMVILTTGMSATTAIESTAELQAYYGAESGLEATLNVLRGNVAPSPGVPTGTKIGFRNALTLTTANLPSDNSTVSRLSGWLPYGNDGRVSPAGVGFSYSVTVMDPDDPNGTIRSADATYRPRRLVVRSTGFGPRGAVKQMEMVVQKTEFELNPKAMLVLRGSENGDKVTFTVGDSNSKYYSGHDYAAVEPDLPTFGFTSDADVEVAQDAITKGATVEGPQMSIVGMGDLPPWLQTTEGPTGARAFLNMMQLTSRSMGRYFTSFSGYAGSSTLPVLTFVNGNATLDGGAGLLIVTGDLILNGNPNFNGIILVLGNGRVVRQGAGNGDLHGTMYVAKFARSWPASENGLPHPFLAPSFETDGAGNSQFRFDSAAVASAMNVLGTIVRDIREY